MSYTYETLEPLYKIVANELKGKEFDNVLEFGCGRGENLLAIAKDFPEKRLVGIDIDPVRLDEAMDHEEFSVVPCDVNSPIFVDKSFDIVFAQALFVMLKKEEVRNVLKNMVSIARKEVILVECFSYEEMKYYDNRKERHRLTANWVLLFQELGLIARIKKIPKETWGGEPWLSKGYIIKVKLQ